MGTLLKLVGGLALGYLALSQVAGKASSSVSWALMPLKLSDLKIKILEGKLTAVIVSRLNIRNDNPVSLYLEGYRADLTQEGQRLAMIDTVTRIELPAGETRQLTAEFRVRGEEFVQRLEQLLTGGQALAPIDIKGKIRLSNGLELPISRRLEFFALT